MGKAGGAAGRAEVRWWWMISGRSAYHFDGLFHFFFMCVCVFFPSLLAQYG